MIIGRGIADSLLLHIQRLAPEGPSLVINPTLVMNLFDLSSFQGKSKNLSHPHCYDIIIIVNARNSRRYNFPVLLVDSKLSTVCYD
jgi:hypothetical protein